MSQDGKIEELLEFFKLMSDATRLKIVALLSREELAVERIAEMLDISSSTVSHHLSKLSRARLVSARAEGYYNVYRLETGAFADMSKRLLPEELLSAVAADADLDAYDRKVLNTYLSPEGRLTSFPVKRKKEEAILRYVVRAFEPGKRYSEKQVNAILSRWSDDTARLRRNLVEFGFMEREGGGGAYWCTERGGKS